MDLVDGIIVGAASAAIGSIIAYKLLNKGPVGGDTPAQINTVSASQTMSYASNPEFGRPLPVAVVDLPPTLAMAAPVVQVNPITEAAHNIGTVQSTPFTPGFGNMTNTPAQETILPF